MKKVILTCLLVALYSTCQAEPFVVIKNPVINGTSMEAKITMSGGPDSAGVNVTPGTPVSIPDTLSIIGLKVVFDIDGDGKTGLAEVIRLLQALANSKALDPSGT